MATVAEALSAPDRRSLWREARTAVDVTSMLLPLAGVGLRRGQHEAQTHAILIPGFGADQRYMAPMRFYLSRRGFACEDWGMGRNLAGVDMRHALGDVSAGWRIEPRERYRGEGSVPYLCDRFVERLRERHRELRRPLSLIGWSLGGYIARECARELPDLVERVITIGSLSSTPACGATSSRRCAGDGADAPLRHRRCPRRALTSRPPSGVRRPPRRCASASRSGHRRSARSTLPRRPA